MPRGISTVTLAVPVSPALLAALEKRATTCGLALGPTAAQLTDVALAGERCQHRSRVLEPAPDDDPEVA